MEPMKPGDRDDLLKRRPAAAPADVDEYERLLSERFNRDPSPRGLRPAAAPDPAEVRLTELYRKLYGSP